MDLSQAGIITHHSRVESWECDFNQHWNARYFCRSFQQASERIAVMQGGTNPGAASALTRGVRFHRELFVGAPVELRSMRIDAGPHAGQLVHLLLSEGTLSATALETPRAACPGLPAIAYAAVQSVLPKDVPAASTIWSDATDDACITECGIVRPGEIDHTGTLLVETVALHAGRAVHDLLARLGFTSEFSRQHGLTRMSVELQFRPLGPCPAGTALLMKTRIAWRRQKSFACEHWLQTVDGAPVVSLRNTVLVIDINARRAVALPDFLAEAEVQ